MKQEKNLDKIKETLEINKKKRQLHHEIFSWLYFHPNNFFFGHKHFHSCPNQSAA